MPGTATLVLVIVALALAILAFVVLVVTARSVRSRESQEMLLARTQVLLQLQEQLLHGEQELLRRKEEFWAPVQRAFEHQAMLAHEFARHLEHFQEILAHHRELFDLLRSALERQKAFWAAHEERTIGQHRAFERLQHEQYELQKEIGQSQWEVTERLLQDLRSLADQVRSDLAEWEKRAAADRTQATATQPVLLGASAPNRARPGEEFTARFIAYVEAREEQVNKLLTGLSSRAEHHLGMRQCRWATGTRVSVRLQAAHLQVTPTDQDFEWEGPYRLVEFDVEVPKDAGEGWTVLKFDVLISGIVVARLRLDLEVARDGSTPGRSSARTKAAASAFASYASQDRPRVLDRLSELKRSGMDVFLDCLSLNPGEAWKPRLEQEIVGRELFLLFWSANAKDSEWVTWEWKTALRHKGLEGIDPHPLDTVTLAAPPDELSSLHFGDPYMLTRQATEAGRPTAAAGGE